MITSAGGSWPHDLGGRGRFQQVRSSIGDEHGWLHPGGRRHKLLSITWSVRSISCLLFWYTIASIYIILQSLIQPPIWYTKWNSFPMGDWFQTNEAFSLLHWNLYHRISFNMSGSSRSFINPEISCCDLILARFFTWFLMTCSWYCECNSLPDWHCHN